MIDIEVELKQLRMLTLAMYYHSQQRLQHWCDMQHLSYRMRDGSIPTRLNIEGAKLAEEEASKLYKSLRDKLDSIRY